MADRYWVGGSATWDGTAGTKWSTTSGGAGGASVPTSADDVFLDGASGTVTVSLSLSSSVCRSLNCTGFTGTLVFTSATLAVYGGITFSTTMTLTNPGSATVNMLATSGSFSITSNGKSFPGVTTLNISTAFSGSTAVISQADALTVSSLVVRAGTFNTSNFSANLGSVSNLSGAAINFGSSTVTLSGTTPVSFVGTLNTFGTSQFNLTNTTPTFNGGNRTFYNVAFTSTSPGTRTINGANTFNNLTFANRSTAGVSRVVINANQTVNGTFTVSSGGESNRRTFVVPASYNVPVTITCAAVSFTDVDFRDITISGAAAPASGTRLGNCGGNSGITFTAAKTVYWNLAAGGSWSAVAWALSSGGSPGFDNFPLAQDTAIIQTTGLNTGATITINTGWNIGSINMGGRSTAMTLATGGNYPFIYGNWTNSSTVSLSGADIFFFSGRNTTQTITSAGRTFTQGLSIICFGGSVVLADAFTSNNTSFGITLEAGTFNAVTYNVTLSSNVQGASGAAARTLAVGSGTWTLSTSGTVWNTGGTGFSVSGTGTINCTSFSNKSFSGNGVSYSGLTLNQGGSGLLTIIGSNTFANITNTYASIGPTSIAFTSGTTTTLSNFTASGQSGRQLSISRSSSTNAILSKTSGTVSVSFCTITGLTATGGAVWEAFTTNGNTNGGNNVGWLFAPAPLATGNMFLMFS